MLPRGYFSKVVSIETWLSPSIHSIPKDNNLCKHLDNHPISLHRRGVTMHVQVPQHAQHKTKDNKSPSKIYHTQWHSAKLIPECPTSCKNASALWCILCPYLPHWTSIPLENMSSSHSYTVIPFSTNTSVHWLAEKTDILATHSATLNPATPNNPSIAAKPKYRLF